MTKINLADSTMRTNEKALTRRDFLAGSLALGGGLALGAASGMLLPTEALAASAGITYQTHVQKVGWQGWKSNGGSSGTSGKGLRLEGIKIKLQNKPVGGSVQYRVHVQTIGWQGWKTDGAMAGTTGRSLRLEAIQVKLTGDMAKNYDVWYRVHAQRLGWMGWAKNGASAGSAGYSYRLEAIQIKLVAKDGSAPGSTTRPYVSEQYTNAQAHKAFSSIISSHKSYARGRWGSSWADLSYRYVNGYGSNLDELVIRDYSGPTSNWRLYVYSLIAGDTRLLLECSAGDGVKNLKFYKNCDSFVATIYSRGTEIEIYHHFEGGEYVEIASRSREILPTGYTPWRYSVGRSSCSKSTFDNKTRKLVSGVVTTVSGSSGWTKA